MRKTKKMLSAVAVVAVMVMLGSVAQANLFDNPGLDYWTDGSGSDAEPYEWTYETGRYSYRLPYDGHDIGGDRLQRSGGGAFEIYGCYVATHARLYQTLTLAAGTYTLSTYYKEGNVGDLGAELVLFVQGVGSEAVATNVETWTLAEKDFVISTAGDYEVGFIYRPEGVVDTIGDRVHLDDTSFVLVPEPATMALLGLGGVGLLVRRRRTRS